ncbi:MAG: hypothetical protein BWZ07_03347 [Alphaproteobacteria bacterium ADurb.BinA280]|nr:MAG: hypothetical protein BWZ07_03347 [Alphaproteobacteria bacterium ADurb.BinA280]
MVWIPPAVTLCHGVFDLTNSTHAALIGKSVGGFFLRLTNCWGVVNANFWQARFVVGSANWNRLKSRLKLTNAFASVVVHCGLRVTLRYLAW